MKPKNIELYIEELVLHGFSPGDRHRIGGAMERELTRLLAEQGTPPSWGRSGEKASLSGGAIEMGPGLSAEVIGARAARAVYRELSR
jgi:hypothetical protein